MPHITLHRKLLLITWKLLLMPHVTLHRKLCIRNIQKHSGSFCSLHMPHVTLLRKLVLADSEWDKMNPHIEPRFHLRLWVEVQARPDDRVYANHVVGATALDWLPSDEELSSGEEAEILPATLDEEADFLPATLDMEAETQAATLDEEAEISLPPTHAATLDKEAVTQAAIWIEDSQF